jgi:hypothetical protein
MIGKDCKAIPIPISKPVMFFSFLEETKWRAPGLTSFLVIL